MNKKSLDAKYSLYLPSVEGSVRCHSALKSFQLVYHERLEKQTDNSGIW